MLVFAFPHDSDAEDSQQEEYSKFIDMVAEASAKAAGAADAAAKAKTKGKKKPKAKSATTKGKKTADVSGSGGESSRAAFHRTAIAAIAAIADSMEDLADDLEAGKDVSDFPDEWVESGGDRPWARAMLDKNAVPYRAQMRNFDQGVWMELDGEGLEEFKAMARESDHYSAFTDMMKK